MENIIKALCFQLCKIKYVLFSKSWKNTVFHVNNLDISLNAAAPPPPQFFENSLVYYVMLKWNLKY